MGGTLLGIGGPSLLAMAWRWKIPIALVGLAAGVLTYIALLQVPPTYVARTQVMLGTSAAPVINIPNVVPDANPNVAFTQSAVILMRSTEVLRAVVEELDLETRKEFNAELRPPGLVEEAKSVLRDILRSIVAGSDDDAADPGGSAGDVDPLAGTIRGLRDAVSVREMGESLVIEIRAESTSPRLAARIADAVAAKYIERQLETKYVAGGEATEWLEGRAQKLREDLNAAEKRVEDFRSTVIDSGKELTADLEPKIAEFTAQITRRTTERDDLMARRQELAQLSEAGNSVSLIEAVGLPALADLHRQASELSTNIARLQAQFGPDYEPIDALRQTRDQVRASFETEIANVISGLDIRAGVLTDRIAGLETDLRVARQELLERGLDELQLRELTREAEASREVYNQFLLRLKEARERSQFQNPDAWIASAAEIPAQPSAPQKGQMSMIAAVVGAALMLVLGTLLMLRSARYVSGPTDIPALTGVGTVVRIPWVPKARTAVDVLDATREPRGAPAAEAVGWLRLAVLPPKNNASFVVMVTSPHRGEGRTTLALLLADAFARSGSPTVLIEADMREGKLASIIVEDAAKTHPFDCLNYTLEAAHADSNGAGFVAGLRTRMTALKRRYKVLVIDAGSALGSADVVEIGLLSNRTLVTCAWKSTQAKTLIQCVETLRASGVETRAIAVNKVPLRSRRKTGASPIAGVVQQA